MTINSKKADDTVNPRTYGEQVVVPVDDRLRDG